MKILITGASGFIGAHLLKAACSRFGADNVIAFSSKKIDSCHSIVYIGPDFNLGQSDYSLLATVEVLIHVGAFTPKNETESNDFKACNGNIQFTEKLLSLQFIKLKKIIFVSSLDVYETAEVITEETRTLPSTLYGLSKLYCESMVSNFSTQNTIVCQILRLGHVYGPGEEKYSKFLPKAIKSIIADGKVELWGDGSELRSLIYIDDVIKAIFNAISLQLYIGVINVVSGTPISIFDLLEKLKIVSGKQVEIIYKEFAGLKKNYVFDNKKVRQHLLLEETDLLVGLKAEFDCVASLP